MHPSINNKELTPECKKALDELYTCRKNHLLGRLFGFCNELERNFNECLMREVNLFY